MIELSPSTKEALERLSTTAPTSEQFRDPSQLSDGYHTFAELYNHRHALCLALMRAMPNHSWFSWRHEDGERCFGGDEWFIIGIDLPGGQTITYHLPAELYVLAQNTGASELQYGRPWDGHTATQVLIRLKYWAIRQCKQTEIIWPKPVTDRRPTEADGDEQGTIQVLINGAYYLRYIEDVKNEPWLHTPRWKPHPEPTPEEIAIADVDYISQNLSGVDLTERLSRIRRALQEKAAHEASIKRAGGVKQ
jgi:hypothetical protein